MTALKKTGVAAMIMVVCIALAIVIGETRKNDYVNPAVTVTESGEVIENQTNPFFKFTTVGAVKEQIEKNKAEQEVATNTVNEANPEDEDSKDGLSIRKIIGIIVLLMIASSILKGKK